MTSALQASALATPPRPPIPDLVRPLTPEELEAALRNFHGSYYVEHPFHQHMYAGTLTRRQFQGWVANRLAYQRVVPRKDGAILSNCPDPAVRREWLQRIVDHDGTRPARAGSSCGSGWAWRWGSRARRCDDERHVLPAVRTICESYVWFCKSKPWVEGCASSLTELFAPKIHQQRIEAFPRHYPWIPPRRSTTSAAAWSRPRGTSSTAWPSCSGTAPRSRRSRRRSRRCGSRSRCCGPSST